MLKKQTKRQPKRLKMQKHCCFLFVKPSFMRRDPPSPPALRSAAAAVAAAAASQLSLL